MGEARLGAARGRFRPPAATRIRVYPAARRYRSQNAKLINFRRIRRPRTPFFTIMAPFF